MADPFEMTLLKEGAEWLGLELTPEQLAQFATYAAELITWNKKFNLTAISDLEGIQTRHFLDSLTCFLGFPAVSHPERERPLSGLPPLCGTSVIDVGAGAGFPGIPLALARPEMSVVLLESTGKKTAFLDHVARTLGLRRVGVVNGRAEEVGQQSSHRERYDVVVSRAVAELAVLSEYCLPFAKLGGRFIAPKKGDIQTEIDASLGAMGILGGRLLEVRPVEVPGMLDRRWLVVVEKVSPAPRAFPRRAGIPAKRPLGRLDS
ncbi:MAG: 16S rRNA (guanine(527)-N(7))-methyltransferase RsmG [Chloroflexi bacterium]|nr:16S rRNA (guanine(527)-N(7))-methyltransferase RsmG [Chloroflexota bacterium]